MLWLALRFPQLALDVFSEDVTDEQTPLLVYQNSNGSKKVLLSNAIAEAFGARRDMGLATAEALLQATRDEQLEKQINQPQAEQKTPHKAHVAFERDTSREWVALQQLATLCYEFTPHVSLHNAPSLTGNNRQSHNLQAGLLLEISGSLKLFKGLESLCQQLLDKINTKPYFAQLGLGPSPEGAWLLSTRYSAISDHSQQDRLQREYLQRLGTIELTKVDCFTESFSQLRKMGLTQLQQVLAMPMVELGRRFGEAFVAYLHTLLGKKSLALSRRAEPKKFHKRAQLNYPVSNLQQLQPVVINLLQQLAQFLRREQFQCEAIEWLLLSATGERRSVTIICQPVHGDWNLLQQLTDIHFENCQVDFEIDSIELSLTQFSQFVQATEDLFASDAELALNNKEVLRRWQLLLTRLHNRLGDNSTLELELLPEHWPEKLNCWQTSSINKPKTGAGQTLDWIEQLQLNGDSGAALQIASPKPSWLIDPPVPLSERGHQLFWQSALTLLLGPERLQGKWWLYPATDHGTSGPTAICRDYFIAEQSDFRRLWIYHDHQAQGWFLQGVFG